VNHQAADRSARVRTACPVCGDDRHQPLYAKYGYMVVACPGCRVRYVNPRPTPEQLKRFYREQYFVGDESGTIHLQHRDIKLGSARLRLALAREFSGKGSLLDIGCGGGLLVQAATEEGWTAIGMDPSASGLRAARRASPVRLVAGQLESAPFKSRRFEVITAMDVLEHVFSPETSLQAARQLLAPNGLLLIETPNMAGWLPRLLGSHHPWVRPPEHLTYFTPDTLRRLLEHTGFRIERLQQRAWKVLSLDYVLSLTRSTNAWLTRAADVMVSPFPALRRRPFRIPMDMLVAVARSD
jgi:2-polyprenyl-3-methyl-5-hydroxy-6-metoxy-1,4-benzoquinol methylase